MTTSTVQPLLVVDAANVIGSRPDGWWRDRAGAVRRLLSELTGSNLAGEAEIMVVVEGQARSGVPPGTVDDLRVVHASGSGDDEIVDVVRAALQRDPGRSVTVVTADRELRSRVVALGSKTVGPRWLWERLERTT